MKVAGARLLLVAALVGGGLAVLPRPAQAAVVDAALVKTTWTGGSQSNWVHPSPDPSGITYNSRTGRLIISDGEVDETNLSWHVYKGTNLYVASLGGELLETGANTLAYSAEPVGVGFRPAMSADFPERLFISDDDKDRVFEVDRGPDGRYGTADDTQTSFSTRFVGSKDDAEDVAVDLELTRGGQLLIIDGFHQEVYVYGPGPNKRFDGLPSAGGDDTVRQFDVAIHGARDPEGIAYNRFRNTVFVLDDASNQVLELGLDGRLLNIVKLPMTMKSGAGIALAPPSTDPTGPYNAYIVDRGVDNDSSASLFNDGRLYEITLPGLTGTTSGPAPTNTAPVVAAGPDSSVVRPAAATLSGSVSDDGLPSGSTVSQAWTKTSGPGGVTFGNAAMASTTATFGAAGTYVLRLTGSDGALSAFDEVTVTVTDAATPPPPPPPGGTPVVLDVPVRAASDDAEESGRGTDLTSSDLELVTDGSRVQTVGLRFTGVDVPAGAVITAAHVQFQVDEVSTGAASLVVAGQAADNPPTFAAVAGDVTGRPRTTATVPWAPETWPTVGDRGAAQRTPDLATVVQEIVNRPGWAGGNALALLVTGSGTRTAEAYESGAAVLHIEYTTSSTPPPPPPATNTAPAVEAGPGSSVVMPDAATLSGSVSDDGLPSGSTVSQAWTKTSGPGGVTFGNATMAATTATFDTAGTYVLRLTGTDGALSAFDEVTVTVTDATTPPPPPPPPPPTGGTPVVLDVPVRAASDDAEESSRGTDLTSSDLELVTDGGRVQTVGMRFTGVEVPAGAVISAAHVQFQVDEVSSGMANLVVAGQAADNPPTFAAVAGDVAGRPRTAATVAWAPEAWPTVGARGAAQRTPDLAPVVQEIVNRPGWAGGNALALLVTGSGERTAEAYEGGAPVLHIEYTTPSTPPGPANTAPVADAGSDQTVALTGTGGTPTAGLPGTLSGVMPEAHGHLGPYVDGNGNLYTMIEDFLANGNEPMAMKSTDGGVTWAEIDRAGRTGTGDLEADWAVQVGTRIYFAFQKSSGEVYLTAFNTSDAPTQPDTWTIALETIHAPAERPADQWVSLAPLNNGDLWAAYSTEATSGQTHRVGLRKRSAETGTWGAEILVDPDRTVSQVVPVAGAGDVTHLFYKDHVAHQVWHRTLSADGELGTPVRLDTGGAHAVQQPLTNAVVSGAGRVTVAWADAVGNLMAASVDGSGTPEPAQAVSDVPIYTDPPGTSSRGAVAHLASDGATVHAVYADLATQDIWHDSAAGGAGWGTDVELVDEVHAMWLSGALTFTNRGALPVLGYLYDLGPHADDGGNIRYGEHALGVVGEGTSTTLAGSVTDDGLPAPVRIRWSVVSGPGGVAFADPTSLTTEVTLSLPGSYVLRLTADDTALTHTDEVMITVG